MAFTNKWKAPNKSTIVTGTLAFPDGVRSVAAIDRQNTIGNGKGWALVHADGRPGGIDTARTARQLDQALAAGKVLYYFQKPGRRPDGSGNFTSGWWTHLAKGVWPTESQDFAWGTAKLAGTAMSNASQSGVFTATANGGGEGGGPSPQPSSGASSGPVINRPAPPPPPPPKSKLPWIVGGVVLVGVGFLLLD